MCVINKNLLMINKLIYVDRSSKFEDSDDKHEDGLGLKQPKHCECNNGNPDHKE